MKDEAIVAIVGLIVLGICFITLVYFKPYSATPVYGVRRDGLSISELRKYGVAI